MGTKEINFICLNCKKEIPETNQYCNHCGQKVKKEMPTLRDLIRDFLDNAFSLDNKLIKSLKGIVRPAYLTKKYFNGERISYFTPIKFFLFSLFVLLAILSTLQRKTSADSTFLNTYKTLVRNEVREGLHNLKNEGAIEKTEFIDTISKALFKDEQDLKCMNFSDFDNKSELNFHFMTNNMTVYDVINMEIDELFRKYEITSWYEKIFLRQTIRIFKSSDALLLFYLGNLIWGILLVILLNSLVLFLLYFRSAHYYIEHVVFGLHVHTFLVLTIAISAIISYLFNDQGFLAPLIIGLCFALYLIVAIKIYYKNTWFKTLAKLFVSSITYVFLLITVFIIILIVSALLF